MKTIIISHTEEIYNKISNHFLYNKNVEVTQVLSNRQEIIDYLKDKEYDLCVGFYDTTKNAQKGIQIGCSGKTPIPEKVELLLKELKNNKEDIISRRDVICKKNDYEKTELFKRVKSTNCFSYFPEIYDSEIKKKENFVIILNKKVDNIDICLNAFDKIILDNKKKEAKKIIKKEEKEVVNEEEKENNNSFSNNPFFFNPYNKL